MAKKKLAPIVAAAATDSGSNRNRIIPVRKITGMKMANVVIVPAKTGITTSAAPSRAAS